MKREISAQLGPSEHPLLVRRPGQRPRWALGPGQIVTNFQVGTGLIHQVASNADQVCKRELRFEGGLAEGRGNGPEFAEGRHPQGRNDGC